MKKLMILLGMILCGLALSFFLRDPGNKPQTQGNPKTPAPLASVEYTVPPMPAAINDFQAGLTFVPARKWKNPAEIQKTMSSALAMMASLAEHPDLQTPDDIAVRAIMERFRTGNATMNIDTITGELGEHVVFGYNCGQDRFGVGSLYTEPALLAVILHHELFHKEQCEREMKKRNISRHDQMDDSMFGDLCQIEAPADAASSRMFSALWKTNKLPRKIHKPERLNDPASTAIETWEALTQGYIPYCQLLQSQYAGREKLLLKKR